MKVIALLLLGFLGSNCAAGPVSKSLAYEPSIVAITGRITRQVFPGRPNFESLKAGDEPEHVWILIPDHPVSIKAAPADQLNVTTFGIKALQVVAIKDSVRSACKRLLNKHVIATGNLVTAMNSHHHTDVLIEVSKVEPAR